jgi:hypothetical protein
MQENSDSSGESDTDTAREDAEEVESGMGSRDEMSPEAENLKQENEQAADRLAFNIDVIEDGETARVDGDAEGSGADDVSEETDASEEYECGEDNAGDDSDTTAGRGEDEGNEDSNDSMVKDTHNDFMANIKESATYISQRTSAAPRKIMEESDDDSE